MAFGAQGNIAAYIFGDKAEELKLNGGIPKALIFGMGIDLLSQESLNRRLGFYIYGAISDEQVELKEWLQEVDATDLSYLSNEEVVSHIASDMQWVDPELTFVRGKQEGKAIIT